MEANGPSVIIVGAGPSGLALATELGSRGIACLVVERNDRVGYAPRAKTTNVRSRTHLRRWGIADKLAALAPFGIEYPSDVHFVTSLAGHRLALIENASNCSPKRNPLYPEHGQWIPQYRVEEVLREQLNNYPSVEVRFGVEFVSTRQEDGGVKVVLRSRSDGGETVHSAAFLVGADGAGSRVREAIGAEMVGTYGLSRNYNIVFRAPGLAQAHAHGPGTMYWQTNPAAPGLVGPMDRDDVWFFMPTKLPEGFVINAENAPELIRRTTGIETPIEVLSSDQWIASALVADRYRSERIFLIGDACHLHPPFGGYGMNMGISDGVDLGWKLAAQLEGWGGPVLLDSYEIERRKIHEEVITEATRNHGVLSNDFWSEELDRNDDVGEHARAKAEERILKLKEREFHTLGTVLGLCYSGSTIILEDGAISPDADPTAYLPSSRPGCLAPHFWRADESSLYDAFGQGFTLICRPESNPSDVRLAVSDAFDAALPLTVLALEPDEATELYPRRLTLVRPDQHVAWRGDDWTSGVIEVVCGRVVAQASSAPEQLETGSTA